MLTEILNETHGITGGEDGWVGLKGYNKTRSQKAFLADEIMRLTESSDLKWSVSASKDIVLATTRSCVVVITRHTQAGGRYFGGTVSSYHLVIFRDGQEVFVFEDKCDNNDYTSSSRRIPLMDIYDVATAGKVRQPRTAHICGNPDFDQSIHTCLGCGGGCL